MKEKMTNLAQMSKPELMAFVKECCTGNEQVTSTIARYSGCSLQWVKEVGAFIVFTVLAGTFDGVYLRDANEYVTVSYNTATDEMFCLSHYLHNYGGYKIYVTEQNFIKQEIGYGWGSWHYAEMDLDLTIFKTSAKQDYGSCCG